MPFGTSAELYAELARIRDEAPGDAISGGGATDVPPNSTSEDPPVPAPPDPLPSLPPPSSEFDSRVRAQSPLPELRVASSARRAARPRGASRKRLPRLLENSGSIPAALSWQRPRVKPRPDPIRRVRRGPRLKPGRDPFVWPRRRRKADEPLRRPIPRRALPPPIRKLPPGQPDWTSPFPVIKVPAPVKLPRPQSVPMPMPLPRPNVPAPPPSSPPPPPRPDIVIPRIPRPSAPNTFPGVPGVAPPGPKTSPRAPQTAPPGRKRPGTSPRPRRAPAPKPGVLPRLFPFPGIPRWPKPRVQTSSPLRFQPLPQPSPSPAPFATPVPIPSPLPSPSPSPAPSPSPLTRVNPQVLSFAQPQPQPRTQRDECECPEPDEEREKRPSNVVARIKGFARRMSQNSLDNLRKGNT